MKEYDDYDDEADLEAAKEIWNKLPIALKTEVVEKASEYANYNELYEELYNELDSEADWKYVPDIVEMARDGQISDGSEDNGVDRAEDTAVPADYDDALAALKTFLEKGGDSVWESAVGAGTIRLGNDLEKYLKRAEEGTIEDVKDLVKLLRDKRAEWPEQDGYFYNAEAMDELLGVVGEIDPDPQPGTDPASIHERKNKQ